VYSEIPNTFNEIKNYLSHINSPIGSLPISNSVFESDFERYVYSYLKEYITGKLSNKITLHNQVTAAGQKRLDFVLYNHDTQKSVAIEVDGKQHFEGELKDIYTIAHIQRIDILTRAGWNIINTPYYKWYNGGWLCDKNDSSWQDEIKRIYSEIDKYIL
jgi:very-short-patch-repair endonuclease